MQDEKKRGNRDTGVKPEQMKPIIMRLNDPGGYMWCVERDFGIFVEQCTIEPSNSSFRFP